MPTQCCLVPSGPPQNLFISNTSCTLTLSWSLPTVPGTPPHNLSGVSNDSMSLSLSWNVPLRPNGVITEYQLQCSGGGKVFSRTVLGSQTTTTLSGLLPYTSYSCNITAHTSAGGGPAATVDVTTAQDG